MGGVDIFGQPPLDEQRRDRLIELVVDLTGLDYMSSRGLRALTMAKREAGDTVRITLAAPNDRMREILAISRYDKLFDVTDEAPAAGGSGD